MTVQPSGLTVSNWEFTSGYDPIPVPIEGKMVNPKSAEIFVQGAHRAPLYEQTFRETVGPNGHVLSDVAFGPWKPVPLTNLNAANPMEHQDWVGQFTAAIPDGGGWHAGAAGTHFIDFVKVVHGADSPTAAYSTWLSHS